MYYQVQLIIMQKRSDGDNLKNGFSLNFKWIIIAAEKNMRLTSNR